MANFFTINSISIFLACLLLGGLYAWVLYGTNKNLAKELKIALTLIRGLLVALVAWLLFAPLVQLVSYTPEKPIIVLAHDNSLSIAQHQAPSFNKQKYEEDLRTLANELDNKYEVKIYNFSDTVGKGFDFSKRGKLSNASALIDRMNDELMNRNVGGIIIATDGIFNRGGNPLYEINKIKAPFYTIALGDTVPKRDLLIANINYNNLVYLDNDFTLEVQVQAFDSKGATTQLSILENGKKIKEQQLSINSASFVQDVPLKIRATKVGIQQYTIVVSALKNEVTTKNNSQNIFVEVIDGRQKVLLAAAAPHPDVATLKQAIERNQHYEVTITLADELNTIDATKFNLAILYQLPNQSNGAPALLNNLRKSKVPSWYIVGSQTNLNALNQFQKKISFGRSNGSVQEVFPYLGTNFTNFTLDPQGVKQLNAYDPLIAPFGNVSVIGNYAVALNQRIGKVNTQNPLLLFTDDEAQKIGVLIGEGIWKWKLEEAKDENSYPLTDEIISKTVQFLSAKDDKRRFKVYSSKNTYDENENIILNATLYNETYESVNTPDVRVQLKNSSGKIFNYTFSKSGPGYRLDAGLLPEGKYTYVATTTLGNKNYTAQGAFFVNSILVEYQQTTANHQLLQTISQQSNGKLFRPENLLQIAQELEKSGQVKTISYEDRRYDELINIKWLFALVMILLTTEWFLRKRNGEV